MQEVKRKVLARFNTWKQAKKAQGRPLTSTALRLPSFIPVTYTSPCPHGSAQSELSEMVMGVSSEKKEPQANPRLQS